MANFVKWQGKNRHTFQVQEEHVCPSCTPTLETYNMKIPIYINATFLIGINNCAILISSFGQFQFKAILPHRQPFQFYEEHCVCLV